MAQGEYTTRHDRMRKIFHRKLRKKLKFDHNAKWYMHKLESILENETHKIRWDFEIQTDHLISARWPDLVIIRKRIKKEKRIRQLVDFTFSVDHRVKLKENEKRDLARELKKVTAHISDVDTNCNWCTRNNPQTFGKVAGELEIGGRAETIKTTAVLRSARILSRVLETCRHSDSSERPSANSTVKKLARSKTISLNSEKSPADSRRLAVTQTSLKDHQLKLGVKKIARNSYNWKAKSYRNSWDLLENYKSCKTGKWR